ncbi:MAG: ATP-dependent zinc metalloprotease FtsH [Firmicutes bacterium]|nr:ATP-dependent zinc metalloprotease FtsH [Bacillota bacterium]
MSNQQQQQQPRKRNPLMIAFILLVVFFLGMMLFNNINLGPNVPRISVDEFDRLIRGSIPQYPSGKLIRVTGFAPGTSTTDMATKRSEILTLVNGVFDDVNGVEFVTVTVAHDASDIPYINVNFNLRGVTSETPEITTLASAINTVLSDTTNFPAGFPVLTIDTSVDFVTPVPVPVWGPSIIHSVIFHGNTTYILRTRNREGVNVPENRVRNFQNNPSRHADYRLFNPNWRESEARIRERNDYFRTQGNNTDTINHFPRVVSTSIWSTVLSWLPFILFAIFLFWILSRGIMRSSGLSGMGKHRAQRTLSSPVRFNDVAGIEEEKMEVEEIVQFLRTPHKFLELGARIPKGFLLVGQPGTGKTLLAKAIAGEAGVPFFSISGSDFSEMLVGVGPSRMRDLFEEAKASAPCIIFIDEIDSIARMRGVGISGAAEENEQTLNQLLVQMDGFTKSEGVIVLAATNRPDVLDPALLRPGRFDRQIVVQMPDVSGREKILGVHTKNKPVGSDVDLKRVAQIISGFTGADIENLMNEAAIIAAKKDRRKIGMQDITEGINKVLLGPQKRSRIITEEDKKITAYHEAGHAVVSRMLQPKHTVQEVSIIPRGMAAGYTLTNDQDDVTAHKSKTFLKAQLALYMGGRAAEDVFIGDICTGAQQDLKVATGLAEKMVTNFGMSEKLGPLYYGRHDEALMRQYESKQISNEMQSLIDGEIKALLVEAMDRAKKVMADKKKEINVMVEVLLERETIYAEDIDLIMAGKSAKQVIKGIEERVEKVREQEKKDRIEQELGIYDREVGRLREIAATYLQANLIDEERVRALEYNIELGRKIITEGGNLTHFPTIDNIHVYGTLVGVETQEVTQDTSTTEGDDDTTQEKNS